MGAVFFDAGLCDSFMSRPGGYYGVHIPAPQTLIDELRLAVSDERVLEAIDGVPRELFVTDDERMRAYDNVALPIACGQTISQPLVVARMCELLELRPADRVLEVGTGSGYHAAVLARLCAHVWSIECRPELSEAAARALAAAGVTNVTLLVGDGGAGLPEEAPFDGICVTAASPAKTLIGLEDQLATGGRLVAPLAGRRERLVRSVRECSDEWLRTAHERVRFVPLQTSRR
jgi:protein-L-isoaspartate(D-aspartate) O-methyltransferase